MNVLIIIPILTGWISAWIANYLADVLPATRRLSHPRCAHCGLSLSIASYLTLRRCPNCHQRRPMRVWIVQIILLAANVYIWFKSPFSIFGFHPANRLEYVLGSILLTYFATVFVIDFEHRLILHPTSIFGALFGLGLGFWINGIKPTLLGGLAGLAIMLVFYFFGLLFSRFRTRHMQSAGQEADDEEALGSGDVVLAGVLGLMLGWPFIWFGLLLGILLGGLAGIVMVLYLMVAKRYRKEALMVFMPYGPFFITGAFLILFLPTWIAPIVPK
ncbi:MAG TPA: A24 family peptidase [Anaerolineales bacterium]|nr:A24 family peptidase [Anaerolineales bacterium]